MAVFTQSSRGSRVRMAVGFLERRGTTGELRGPRVDSRPVTTSEHNRGPGGRRAALGIRPRSVSARIILPIVAGLMLAMLVALPALGHADLVRSDPAADSILSAPPETITLRFSEGLDAAKSSFKILGPDGTAGTGRASKDGSRVMAATGLVLGPGVFTIEWAAVAEDGHVERGTLAFTVSEPSPAPATPTPPPATVQSASPSVTATATPAPTTPPSAVPSPGPGSGTDTTSTSASGSDVILPIAVALALVALVGVLVLRRSRTA